MKRMVLSFVFALNFCTSSSASESDCTACAGELEALTMSEQNIVALSEVNQALANEVSFSSGQQLELCHSFLDESFNALKTKFVEYGTTLQDSYDKVKCQDGRRDLLKYRMLDSTGRSDLAAFIMYYKRDLNDEAALARIFNTVVPGPGAPNGTLLDFIEFYRSREGIDPVAERNYSLMITLLRNHGAKKASEL